jgi:Mg-chelatase subunit ChlD
MAQKVHVGIVLDRSGSMEDCREDAIGAVNSYLRQVKNDKELEGRVSLIIFDSHGIDVIRDRVSIAGCADLGAGEYQPRAQTPLLDAVGHGVALLDKHKEAGERCILAVMTDGLENASREYTKETIKALLDRKQKEDGWLVLYLGAGHDAWSQARDMGLHAGNVAAFSKQHMMGTMSSLATRQRRYAFAHEPAAEAASGGFTDEERARMQGNEK